MNIWDRISRAGQPKDSRIRRDPLSIGVWIAFNAGAQAVAPWLAYAIGSAVLGAAAIGLSLLANAIFNQAPNSTDRQASIKQSLGARLRYYGRVKVGGTVAFFEDKAGFLYQLVTLNWGQISGVVDKYLNDKSVSTDSGGYVEQDDFISDGRKRVRLQYKTGGSAQTAHQVLIDNFPSVDANFRLRNMANVLGTFEEVKREDINRVYPQLNPSIISVIDASLCLRVRQGDVAWSDNSWDIIYDYLVGRDGSNNPWGGGYDPSQINIETFMDAAETADDDVPLKGGGTIKRYRLWGGFAMNEPIRTVTARMLRTCDGDLYLDTQGRIAARGGRWEAPVLTLDADKGHILSADLRHGSGSYAAFNELTLSYTDDSLDYQQIECDPWIDEDSIEMRGAVLPEALDLRDVPHHAQARRLGKIYTKKANPEWSGTIMTNFYGINAIGENMVRVKFPLLGIDADFMIRSLRIMDNLTGVELTVSSLSEDAYAWDAETEEGNGPTIPPDTSTGDDLAPPDNIQIAPLAAEGAIVFVVTWDQPDRDALTQQVQYTLAGGGSGWIEAVVAQGQNTARTGPVSSGELYDIRVRTISPAGAVGPWIVFDDQLANPQPDALTSVSYSGGTGGVNVGFRTPASPFVETVKLYRVPAGGVLNKTTHVVATYPVSPSTTYTKVDGEIASSFITNGSFSSDTAWTKNTGWTISGGTANGAAGTNSSILQAMSVTAGAVLRIGWNMVSVSAGTAYARLIGGSGNVDQAAQSTIGQKLASLTVASPTANVSIGINKNSAFVGSVDNFVAYVQTVNHAPQGVWDYYIEPVSDLGVAGPTAGPSTMTII